MAAPETFVMILFSDPYHREALSPDVAQLSLSSDTTLSPSPPVCATAAPGNRIPKGFRARRLRLGQANSEHLPDSGRVSCSHGTGDTEQTLHRVQQLTRTNVALLALTAHTPCPPPSSALHEGLMDSRYTTIKACV